METTASIDLVIQNILQQYPIQLDFVGCGKIVSYSPAASYVARKRGHFPVRVRLQGGRLVCHTSDLVEYLRTGLSQADQSHQPLYKKNKAKKTGRPSKMESLAAASKGLTVKQLRAAAGGAS